MKNDPLRVVRTALAGLLSLLLPALAGAQSSLTIPPSLTAAIRAIAPGADILSPQEIDATACAPLGASPNTVRADFNGDSLDDYALLLKMKETGKVSKWEGRELRQADLALAIFLADKAGSFHARVVREFLNYLPAAVALDLQPAGKVRHRDTNQTVTLKSPGVTLSFCEKSATTYYLAGDKVRSIPISD